MWVGCRVTNSSLSCFCFAVLTSLFSASCVCWQRGITHIRPWHTADAACWAPATAGLLLTAHAGIDGWTLYCYIDLSAHNILKPTVRWLDANVMLEWAKIYVDCRIAAQTRICETTQLNQLAIPCCNVTSGMLYSHAIGLKFFNILSSGERCSVNFGLLRRALHYWHNPGH